MTFRVVIAAVFLLDVALVWRVARTDRRVARAQAHRHFFDVLIDDTYIGTSLASASVAIPTPPVVADAETRPVLVPVNFQGTRTEDEGRTFLESVS